MSTQQNQINLKEKSTLELKAIAFDIKTIIDQYGQMYQTVIQEIAGRQQAEAEAASEQPTTETEAPVKKMKAKS